MFPILQHYNNIASKQLAVAREQPGVHARTLSISRHLFGTTSLADCLDTRLVQSSLYTIKYSRGKQKRISCYGYVLTI